MIHNTRDRALILLLLRTGIRIGEALGLTLNDLDLRDRKVHLFQGEKNSRGEWSTVSDDALFALKRWLKRRDPEKQFLFYGLKDRPLCYSAALSASRNISPEQNSPRRATRCIAYATPWPPSY